MAFEFTILFCGLGPETTTRLKKIVPPEVQVDVMSDLFEKFRPRPLADYNLVLYNVDKDPEDRFLRTACPACRQFVMVTKNRGADLLVKSMEPNCIGIIEEPFDLDYISQLLFSKNVRAKRKSDRYILAKD